MNESETTQNAEALAQERKASLPTPRPASGSALKFRRQKAADHEAGPLPSAFEYQDYRLFLSDWVKRKKKGLAGFSGRSFAQRAGIASGTLLGMVIRGQRNLSASTTRGFIKALGLSGPEARYFEMLVLHNQSHDLGDRNYYLSQLANLAPPGKSKIELKRISDYQEYLSSWHHPIIKEIITLEDFEAKGEWISRILGGAVTPTQAEQSLACLKRLGMLEQNPEGRWTVTDAKILLDPIHPNAGIQNFHKVYLEQAARFAVSKPRDAREFGFVTLAVSEEEFQSICNEVSEFWKAILAKYPMGESRPDRVVTLSVQAVQVTQTVSNFHENKREPLTPFKIPKNP